MVINSIWNRDYDSEIETVKMIVNLRRMQIPDVQTLPPYIKEEHQIAFVNRFSINTLEEKVRMKLLILQLHTTHYCSSLYLRL